MQTVLVIGSSNTDMVIRLPELPRPGETVSGGEFRTFAGGKGANQAIAACRAGGRVRFLGAVGDDDFGRSATALMTAEGIDTSGIDVVPTTASGVALIFVNDAGENCIGVAPGANRCITPESLDARLDAFDGANLVLLQLETPIAAVARAKALAAERGLPVILNPAPAAPLSGEILDGLFCITPNETEAEALTGIAIRSDSDATAAADALLAKGVRHVVITLGARGALLAHASRHSFHSAASVKVVDTTGAGDTFNGVFAAMLVAGMPTGDAVDKAIAAASISVQRAGAIASIPFLREFD